MVVKGAASAPVPNGLTRVERRPSPPSSARMRRQCPSFHDKTRRRTTRLTFSRRRRASPKSRQRRRDELAAVERTVRGSDSRSL